MKPRVNIIVNSFSEKTPTELADKYLNDCDISFSTYMPLNPAEYQIIILWNLRKIIKDLPDTSNIVVFHSSDLPKGRGWAPIYYAIANTEPKHVITAILASEEVDSGNIICKASFPILNSYCADDLRKIDEAVCFLMANRIINRFKGKKITGKPQSGIPTYNKRRHPSDSKVDINQPLTNLLPHIKACSSQNPAYFEISENRFEIIVKSAATYPIIPPDLEINFEK